jgi:hypothetical protein
MDFLGAADSVVGGVIGDGTRVSQVLVLPPFPRTDQELSSITSLQRGLLWVGLRMLPVVKDPSKPQRFSLGWGCCRGAHIGVVHSGTTQRVPLKVGLCRAAHGPTASVKCHVGHAKNPGYVPEAAPL